MGMCAAYTDIEEASSYFPNQMTCKNGNFKQADKEQIEAFEQMHNLRAIMLNFGFKDGNHYAVVGSEQYNKERVFNSLNRLHQKKNIDTIAINNKKGVAEHAKEWAVENDVSWVKFNLDDYNHAQSKNNSDLINHLTGLVNDDYGNIGVVIFGNDNFDMIMKCNQANIKIWEVDK